MTIESGRKMTINEKLAFELGYKKGRYDANKWIDVKDELPGKHGQYLVTCKNIDIAQIRLWEGTWDSLEEITHWMPLPQIKEN